MQIKTWFGIFRVEEDQIVDVELFKKDIDYITNLLLKEALLLRGKVAGQDIRSLALKYGFVESDKEYDTMLHEISIQLVKKQIAEAITEDKHIIAAVEAIDDINTITNILAERLKEWYMLSYTTDLKARELAQHITQITSNSPELRAMQSLASTLLRLYESRSIIEEYVKQKMHAFAPNLSSIAGHILGARLLSIAGSLEKLAYMPSSTIQVMGANKALFKHLKGKAPSPKHGLIYRHPLVNTAQKKLRGKIARALASKISLASRYDYYSKELKENLLNDLEKKVSDIKLRD